MDPDPLRPSDAEALLRYAQVTYAAVTEQRRRITTALFVVAALFGVLALVCGVRWAATAGRIGEVRDEALVDTLGVRVPDPRPAFERAELRLRAFGWAVLTGGCLLVAVITGSLAALLRPTPLPPELQHLAPRRGRAPPPP